MSDVRILDVAQGSPAWHAARRIRYGASELGKLAGVSPWGGPADVWRRKLGRPEGERPRELWHRVGHALEGLARDLFTEAGLPCEAGPVIAEERGWLLASLDHWTTAGREPVDAKVRFRGSPEWALWTEGTIPEDVALQLTQQALLVERLTGKRLDAAHIAALLVDAHGVSFRAYRLPLTAERRELQAEIGAAVPRWHAAYVETRMPPPDAAYRDVAAVVDTTATTRREATAEEVVLLAAWREREAACTAARRALKDAEAERDTVKDPLARRLGPDHTIPGVRWAPWGDQVRFTLEK